MLTTTKKRKVSFLVVLFTVLIAYFILVDPDTPILTNLSFGIELLLTLKIFILSMFIIVLCEFTLDHYREDVIKHEPDYIDATRTNPMAAALVLISLSIRFLAYVMVFFASTVGVLLGNG